MGNGRNILGGLLLAGGFCIAHAQTAVNISGTVTNSGTGAVVAGAKVFLAGNPDVTTTTGADGTFVLSGQATVGVKAGAVANSGKSEMSLKGTQLSISVSQDNTPITIDVYNLKNQLVRNLVNRTAGAGKYTLNAFPAGLHNGMYLVQARVGAQTKAFKMTAMGFNSGFNGLVANPASHNGAAKTAVDPIDSLKITKDGYKVFAKAITKYTGILTLAVDPKLTPGDLKIVSERNMPQVFWGKNVDVQVWDNNPGTQLNGSYKAASFEGGQSWLVTFSPGQAYSAWGFVTTAAPEDMSAWIGGTMHLAVRGTVSSIGITMASADQGGGTSVKVNLADYGYKPQTSISDTAWHEVKIPMDQFVGVDFSQINVYCGIVAPVESDTTPFDTDGSYLIDDIYWSLKK